MSYEFKQAKIVKLNKIKENAVDSLIVTDDEEYSAYQDSFSFIHSTPPSKQHKQLITSASMPILNSSTCSSSNDKSGTLDEEEEEDSDVCGEYLQQSLYIIKDYNAQLAYGDLSVRKGELVYLICDSDSHCFVENKMGKQGFIPKDICIDLDDTIRRAQIQLIQYQSKQQQLEANNSQQQCQ